MDDISLDPLSNGGRRSRSAEKYYDTNTRSVDRVAAADDSIDDEPIEPAVDNARLYSKSPDGQLLPGTRPGNGHIYDKNEGPGGLFYEARDLPDVQATAAADADDDEPIEPAVAQGGPQAEDPALPLGYLDVCAFIVNKMIGTGIYTAPPAVLLLTRSKIEALLLWILGFIYTLVRSVLPVSSAGVYADSSLAVWLYTCSTLASFRTLEVNSSM